MPWAFPRSRASGGPWAGLLLGLLTLLAAAAAQQACMLADGTFTLEKHCKRCGDGWAHPFGVCLECEEGYELVSGFEERRVCSNCPNALPNCITCVTGTSLCERCEQYYELQEGACVVGPLCPVGVVCDGDRTCAPGGAISSYGGGPGICQPCGNRECVSCSKHGPYTCDECRDGYVNTPSGMGCYSCPFGCKKCIFASGQSGVHPCKECADGYYPQPVQEGGEDDSGPPTVECVPCDDECGTCAEAGVCLTCRAGYYLRLPGECAECPQSCSMCVAAPPEEGDDETEGGEDEGEQGTGGSRERSGGGESDSQPTAPATPEPPRASATPATPICTFCMEGFDDPPSGCAVLVCGSGRIDHCLRCSGAKCAECVTGWRLSVDGLACIDCDIPACTRCIKEDDGDTATYSCDRCATGYYLTDFGFCESCGTGCASCRAPTVDESEPVCLRCAEGYITKASLDERGSIVYSEGAACQACTRCSECTYIIPRDAPGEDNLVGEEDGRLTVDGHPVVSASQAVGQLTALEVGCVVCPENYGRSEYETDSRRRFYSCTKRVAKMTIVYSCLFGVLGLAVIITVAISVAVCVRNKKRRENLGLEGDAIGDASGPAAASPKGRRKGKEKKEKRAERSAASGSEGVEGANVVESTGPAGSVGPAEGARQKAAPGTETGSSGSAQPVDLQGKRVLSPA